MGSQENATTKNGDQAGSAPTPKPHAPCGRDWFCVNFAWMIIIGVLTLFWIGRFTDYLETVIGLLGLGGIFAWAAFLFNVLSESRKKELQSSFEGFVKHKRTSLALVVCTAVLVLIGWNTGCITADSGRDTLDRHIEIRRQGSTKPSRAGNLSQNIERKFPVLTGFRGRTYEIDVEGLPVIEELVRPFSRVRLKVPGDFRRRSVVLVRPGGGLSAYSSDPGSDHQLVVRLDDDPPREMPFHGHTVWIGSGKKLDIPTSLKEKWRIEIAADNNADESTLVRWLQPAVFDEIRQLEAGKIIEISVKATGRENPFAHADPVKVLPCEGREDFPQVIDIEQK